jgi:glycosyltransferase involved in cell wall biosynthesis
MRISVSVTNDLVTDQRVHKVSTTLRNAGYEVKLIGRKLPDSKPLKREYQTYRMRLLFKKSFFFYAEYNIRLFLFLLFSKTDILLSNDTDTLIANYLVSKIKNKPLVFDAHEMFPEVPEVINRKFVKNFWTKIENRIFPKLKYSYTVCKSIADIYNERYNIDMKVVRNIPFANRKISDNKPICKNGKKIIVYQGAVNVGRGIECVIEAMQYIDDHVFYVIGDGDILPELKKLALYMCVEDKVIFLGKIPFEELSAYTACADIGVNILENRGLNYYYALPNRIFDFIRNNVMILSSDFPEIRRIVSHYKVGRLIDKYDPEYLATVISDMSSKPIDEDIFNIANKELTWEKETEVLLRIIESSTVRE